MKKQEKLPDNIKPEMIGEKRYVRMAGGAKRYSVGLNTFRTMAAEAHAIIHVRRIVLIDTKMIDEKYHVYIVVNTENLASEINGVETNIVAAIKELEQVGLLETKEDRKVYLRRFV